VTTTRDGRDRVPVVGRADDQSVDILVVEHPPAVTGDDESEAAAEPDAEAPAPSPEAKPDMAASVLEPSPSRP
jgi:hypothetical protein